MTDTNSPIAARIAETGAKKILSCDGGGIRGLMSVEILSRIESDLRNAFRRPDLVLADYFDFICGTSTGAIIAACLSAGMSTASLREFYVNSGKDMFDRASILKRLQYQYNDEPLARKLKAELNRALGYDENDAPATLGDDRLRTLLMMVMRNHSTDSPWPLSNNPSAHYNDRRRADCNLNLPLWQLVRASSAAPVYFPPEVITLGEGKVREYQFVFVDGGVTTYNNPAFLAFQMATASPYAVNWPTGTDKLLIVSVGTGRADKLFEGVDVSGLNVFHYALHIPSALMNAAAAGWDMACRIVGECRFGPRIDREFGDMVLSHGSTQNNWTGAKAFAYVRYDLDLSQNGLFALGVGDIGAETVQKLDSYEHLNELQRVGTAYAEKHVNAEHLRGFIPSRT